MRRHVLALLVLLVTASIGVRERRVSKAFAEMTAVDQVDMGITLHVVRKSPDGKKVKAPTPANIIRTHHLGGMVQIGGAPVGWDVATMGPPPSAFYTGPSLDPVVWMCSADQEPLILHGPDAPTWTLIQGSEGAGKSVGLVMWTALRVLDYVGRNVTGAITVPTNPRFRAVKKEIAALWPARWMRWRERDHAYQFHAGPIVQVISAVQRSAAAGAPLQGDSLEWCASDELQDHFTLEADIMSRGRGSDRYLRFCTSTSKDLTEWRDFRGKVAASPLWKFAKMIGLDSPFVDADFWTRYRASGTVTEREWRRRILAEDVGPERQVYFNWRRSHLNGRPANLAPLPEGAIDITAQVLAPWATNATVLVGHDPGQRQHVSLILKAYRLPGQRRDDDRPRWFVVDEMTSPESTVHAHAQQVFARLREKWGCYGVDWRGKADPTAPCALIRIDPHTRGEGDAHPGSDVATIWRGLGMTARAAAYHASTTTVSPATIKRRQRIDMINTLLAATDAVGEVRRLFVQLVDDKPVAPMLVKAIETMEFDAAGHAETERKDAADLSHWPAALGYALFAIEAPRLKLEHAA